jgi:PA14 domain
MPNTRRSLHLNSRRGTVLVAMTIALVMLQMVVVLVVAGGSRMQLLRATRHMGVQAQYAAEAGVQLALREIATNFDVDGDGGVGTIRATGPALTLNNSSVRVTRSGDVYTASASGTSTRRSIAVVAAAGSSDGSGGLRAEFWAGTIGSQPACSVGHSDAAWTSPTPSAVGRVHEAVLPGNGYLANQARWLGGTSDYYGVRLTGQIWIPVAGNYTFGTNSDDASGLWINGAFVVTGNWFNHANQWVQSSPLSLNAGWHDIDIRFTECGGGDFLGAAVTGPGYPSWTPIRGSIVRAPSVGLAPLSVHGTASISGSASVRAFRSSVGVFNASTNNVAGQLLISTNSTAAGAISVTGSGSVNGNVACGPGGSTGTAITVNNGASVTGSQTVLIQAVGITPQNQIPSGAWADNWPAAPATVGVLTYSSGAASLSADTRCSQLTVTGGAVLTISQPISIYVDGNMQVDSGGQIVVASGVSATIYVGGSLTIYNGGRVNMSPGLPGQLRIEGNFTGSSAYLVDVESQLAAYVNTTANSLTVTNGSSFFGTYRGPNFTAADSALVHLDLSADAGTAAAMTLTSWSAPNPNP